MTTTYNGDDEYDDKDYGNNSGGSDAGGDVNTSRLRESGGTMVANLTQIVTFRMHVYYVAVLFCATWFQVWVVGFTVWSGVGFLLGPLRCAEELRGGTHRMNKHCTAQGEGRERSSPLGPKSLHWGRWTFLVKQIINLHVFWTLVK